MDPKSERESIKVDEDKFVEISTNDVLKTPQARSFVVPRKKKYVGKAMTKKVDDLMTDEDIRQGKHMAQHRNAKPIQLATVSNDNTENWSYDDGEFDSPNGFKIVAQSPKDDNEALTYYIQSLRQFNIESFPEEFGLVHFKLGQIFARNKSSGQDRADDVEKALFHFQTCLQVYTSSARPLQFGLAALSLGRLLGERADFIQMLHPNRGRTKIKTNIENGVENLQIAVGSLKGRTQAEARVALAQGYLQKNKYHIDDEGMNQDSARRSLEKALDYFVEKKKQAEGSSEPQKSLRDTLTEALILTLLGQSYLEEAKILKESDPDSHLMEARQAIDLLNRAVQILPKDSPHLAVAHSQIARAYLELDDSELGNPSDKATNHLMLALELSKGNAEITPETNLHWEIGKVWLHKLVHDQEFKEVQSQLTSGNKVALPASVRQMIGSAESHLRKALENVSPETFPSPFRFADVKLELSKLSFHLADAIPSGPKREGVLQRAAGSLNEARIQVRRDMWPQLYLGLTTLAGDLHLRLGESSLAAARYREAFALASFLVNQLSVRNLDSLTKCQVWGQVHRIFEAGFCVARDTILEEVELLENESNNETPKESKSMKVAWKALPLPARRKQVESEEEGSSEEEDNRKGKLMGKFRFRGRKQRGGNVELQDTDGDVPKEDKKLETDNLPESKENKKKGSILGNFWGKQMVPSNRNSIDSTIKKNEDADQNVEEDKKNDESRSSKALQPEGNEEQKPLSKGVDDTRKDSENSPSISMPHFEKGDSVFYLGPHGIAAATIVEIHYDDGTQDPYFTIKLPDGSEKQTVKGKLTKNNPNEEDEEDENEKKARLFREKQLKKKNEAAEARMKEIEEKIAQRKKPKDNDTDAKTNEEELPPYPEPQPTEMKGKTSTEEKKSKLRNILTRPNLSLPKRTKQKQTDFLNFKPEFLAHYQVQELLTAVCWEDTVLFCEQLAQAKVSESQRLRRLEHHLPREVKERLNTIRKKIRNLIGEVEREYIPGSNPLAMKASWAPTKAWGFPPNANLAKLVNILKEYENLLNGVGARDFAIPRLLLGNPRIFATSKTLQSGLLHCPSPEYLLSRTPVSEATLIWTCSEKPKKTITVFIIYRREIPVDHSQNISGSQDEEPKSKHQQGAGTATQTEAAKDEGKSDKNKKEVKMDQEDNKGNDTEKTTAQENAKLVQPQKRPGDVCIEAFTAGGKQREAVHTALTSLLRTMHLKDESKRTTAIGPTLQDLSRALELDRIIKQIPGHVLELQFIVRGIFKLIPFHALPLLSNSGAQQTLLLDKYICRYNTTFTVSDLCDLQTAKAKKMTKWDWNHLFSLQDPVHNAAGQNYKKMLNLSELEVPAISNIWSEKKRDTTILKHEAATKESFRTPTLDLESAQAQVQAAANGIIEKMSLPPMSEVAEDPDTIALKKAQSKAAKIMNNLQKARVLHLCCPVQHWPEPSISLAKIKKKKVKSKTTTMVSPEPLSAQEILSGLHLPHCGLVCLTRGGMLQDVSDVAEYMGVMPRLSLEDAFLCSGTQTVMSSLWTDNRSFSASLVLLIKFYQILPQLAGTRRPVVIALNEAQKFTRNASLDDIRTLLQESNISGKTQVSLDQAITGLVGSDTIHKSVKEDDQTPFKNPFFWANFRVFGAGTGTHDSQLGDSDNDDVSDSDLEDPLLEAIDELADRAREKADELKQKILETDYKELALDIKDKVLETNYLELAGNMKASTLGAFKKAKQSKMNIQEKVKVSREKSKEQKQNIDAENKGDDTNSKIAESKVCTIC